ncbi:MAG: hypothetical protein LBR74_04850 [Eubacterium sp.]|jgi:hypothetical protein|nr:hypothetical protein [Eubacterium sp.]
MNSKNYWQTPPDREIDTGKNVLKYWKSAGKLQISMCAWRDKDGNENHGKTVALNLDSLRNCPEALGLLKNIFAEIG